MLREMVREWTKEHVEPQALEFDRDEKFNVDLLRSMGELGLLGISAQEDYGGAALDAVACTMIHEELSASDPGFALAYLAHSMLFVNNLAYNGNEEQKERILPKVCSGEWIGAMAMSEPDAGTDVLGLSTTAIEQADGSWLLNGRKMWITNGCLDELGTPADVVWVYARTGADEKGRVQMSTFLVEAGMVGYSVGQKIYDKTGMRASNTAELVFDDCIVPAANLVGGVGGFESTSLCGAPFALYSKEFKSYAVELMVLAPVPQAVEDIPQVPKIQAREQIMQCCQADRGEPQHDSPGDDRQGPSGLLVSHLLVCWHMHVSPYVITHYLSVCVSMNRRH